MEGEEINTYPKRKTNRKQILIWSRSSFKTKGIWELLKTDFQKPKEQMKPSRI